jgi:hypothetical protein
MCGLPVEAKLRVLEKLGTQCCSVHKHFCCFDHVRNRILENRLNHVSGVLMHHDYLS